MGFQMNLEDDWAKGCNTTCSHDGICSLDWDHVGDHSASGFCTWPRSNDDNRETLEEGLEGSEKILDV